MSPAGHRSSQRAEQGQGRTDHQGDNAQCPQNRDPEQETEYQQDDTQRNNDELLTVTLSHRIRSAALVRDSVIDQLIPGVVDLKLPK
ncbi:hypothetical protein AB0M22_45295 [Nocardia sp. NPDC051756]|uniref:hypothetical protein n=1 Tax=Nocardia sp. NPDC051756 TaxID=3154751 RepID=UPI00341C82F2